MTLSKSMLFQTLGAFDEKIIKKNSLVSDQWAGMQKIMQW